MSDAITRITNASGSRRFFSYLLPGRYLTAGEVVDIPGVFDTLLWASHRGAYHDYVADLTSGAITRAYSIPGVGGGAHAATHLSTGDDPIANATGAQNGLMSPADKTKLDAVNMSALNASALTSGTVPDARFPATLPALNGSALTALNASALASGTVPDARFPATLPALNGSALAALNASALASGTVPDARFPATLPALNGSALTALNASNLSSGTVPDARFPATLPAASGVNLTALNATQLTTGSVSTKRMGNLNVFHVDDYGAVGDGSTNDSPAIALAIAAAAPTYGAVIFGVKNYKITTPIAVTSFTTLRGSGTGFLTSITGSGIAQVLTVADNTGVIVENITFSCSGNNSSAAVLLGSNLNTVVFRNCDFNLSSFPVALQIGNGGSYEFSRFTLTGSGLGLGLSINSGASAIRLSDVHVDHISGIGIQLSATTAVLDDVSVVSCSSDGLKITGGGAYLATGLVLKSNGINGLNITAAVTNSSFSGISVSNTSYGVKDAATTNTGTVYDFLTASNGSGDSSILSTGSFFNKKNASVTLQGNTFNAASKLVQLTAANKFPALDGSLITNLPAPPSLARPFVHIDDYGAAGDGVTNDDAAFTAAIAACSAGGTICLGPKNYLVHSTIDLGTKGLSLFGQGGVPGGASPCIQKSTSGNAIEAGNMTCKIADLGVYTSDNASHAINITGGFNTLFTVERVVIACSSGAGTGCAIRCVSGPEQLIIRDCFIHDFGVGIHLSSCVGLISGCKMPNSVDVGIELFDCSQFTIDACNVSAATKVLRLSGVIDTQINMSSFNNGATIVEASGDCSRCVVDMKIWNVGAAILMSLSGTPNPSINLNQLPKEIHVDDYGAFGDGVVDDWGAINLALADAATLKIPCVFGPKTYYIASGELDVPANSCLKGSGLDNTQLQFTTEGFVLASSTSVSDMSITAAIGTGIRAASMSRINLTNVYARGSVAGITLSLCTHCVLDNVSVAFAVDGIRLETCSDSSLSNIHILSCSNYGLLLVGNRLTINNLVANSDTAGAQGTGIYIDGSCNDVLITGVTTEWLLGLSDIGGAHNGVVYQIVSNGDTTKKTITSTGSAYYDLAVAPTVLGKQLPTFHVDDYGAVGDSSTDDSAAFNAALTAAGVDGGIVLMGLKSYALAGNINLATATVLRGCGLDRTTLILSSSAFINITSASEVSLEDFTVTGDTTNYNVLISSGSGIKISNVRSTGNFIGFSIGAAQQVLCDNVIVDTCNLGFDINGCSEVSMSNVQAKGCGTGIYLEGTTNANIRIDSITAGNTVVGVQDDCTTSNNVVIVNASYNDLVKKVINGTATYVDLNTVGVSASPIKAWLSFDYIGATVNIRASANIASVTRTAAGRYQVTFTTPFADVYYGVDGSGRTGTHAGRALPDVDHEPSRTTSVSDIYILDHTGAPTDPSSSNDQMNVTWFGNQ